jgi:hypothetical protein
VVGRADEDHLVAEERLVGDRAVPRRRTDDAELELAPRDLLDDRLCVGDREVDGHLGVRLRELTQEDRDDRAAGAGRGAHGELAAQRPLRFARDVLEELTLEREQPLRAAIEPVARLCRLDPPPGAVEELLADALLQRADLLAHRGLGDAEPLGGL